MFWGLLWGVGISTPSPHPLTAGRCPTGRLNQRGRGRGDPLPAGLCSYPEPWPPAGRSAPFGFQSSFSPVLPLFLSPTVFCHQFSDGEKKTAQSPTSPSHKYACAFPEPFSAPFSPPTPTPAQVGAAMQRAFFFSHPETNVSASAGQFHSTRPHLLKPTPYQFSFLPVNLIPSHC